MKNPAQSIRNRLVALGKRENIWFNYLIVRFLHERLLYRLSASSYADKFCLKGGALLYALEGVSARQTRDLDLLGRQLSNEPENIKLCFAEILVIPCEEDGVIFDVESLQVSEIVKEGNYKGTRLEFWARLGQIKEKMQVDIGFGDTVIPASILMDFPTLLDLPMPKVHAYSVESVIAEKFHAMIYLGELNSRMKDFYDVYHLLRPEKFDSSVLRQAIIETFENRATEVPKAGSIFLPEFSQNDERQKLWITFLKKSKLAELNFEEVITYIEMEISRLL